MVHLLHRLYGVDAPGRGRDGRKEGRKGRGKGREGEGGVCSKVLGG